MLDNLNAINIKSLWEKTKGKGSVVAVLDSGVDIDHPDLKDCIMGGINLSGYTSESANYDTQYWHGVHVAGIIHSIAPEAKLLIVKVINDKGLGLRLTLVEGLRYIIDWRGENGEKVCAANISMIGKSIYDDEYNLIKEAASKGISIVCGAGNDGDGNAETIEIAYPAAYPESICVASCNNYGKPSGYCDTNNEIDIVAPGEGIYSTTIGGYRTASGTSMATPHVSGVLALINSLEPNLTEQERYEQLIKCTRDLGLDKKAQGYGILDCSKYTLYEGNENNMRGIIVMNTLSDLPGAVRLHNRYHFPIIEMQFAGEDERNAKIKLQVGNTSTLFTPDTMRMAGKDRDETDGKVTEFINAHPTI